MALAGKKSRLASNADRDAAESFLRRHHEEGRLDDDQLAERISAVRAAKTLADLEPVNAGLPKRGFATRGADNKLASDADREGAVTRLNQHHHEGRIDDEEFDARKMRARGAQTHAELDELFKDLPSLGASLGARLPGHARKRADNAQRIATRRDLERHHAAGRLSEEELTRRTVVASSAEAPADLAALLADLPKLGPSGNVRATVPLTSATRRASDAHRRDAVRKLELHRDQGNLTAGECDLRVAAVEAATTPKEIDESFADLPRLKPQRLRGRERFVSDRARREAVEHLDDDLLEGRIEQDEHEIRVQQVYAARSREEIEAAFRGLTLPRLRSARDRAGKVVGEGVDRARNAFFGWLRAVGALLIALALLMFNDDITPIPGLAFLVVSIVLFVWAVRVLFSRSRTR